LIISPATAGPVRVARRFPVRLCVARDFGGAGLASHWAACYEFD